MAYTQNDDETLPMPYTDGKREAADRHTLANLVETYNCLTDPATLRADDEWELTEHLARFILARLQKEFVGLWARRESGTIRILSLVERGWI